jgi:hypothetical protein
MTEYRSGFISSIIDRSDQILNRDRYDVTRLLMLLSVGYAMVWERLKFYSNDKEQNVSESVKGNKFEKKLGKSICDGPLRLGSFQYFETFCKSDEWKFYEVLDYQYKYAIEDLLDALGSEQIIERSELKYSTLMRCLRNSLAHGGVHPLSPRQSKSNIFDEFTSFKLGVGSSEKINKIVFVAKKTDHQNNAIGFQIIVMSVNAAYYFWQDWRALLIKNEYFDYAGLDNAA